MRGQRTLAAVVVGCAAVLALGCSVESRKKTAPVETGGPDAKAVMSGIRGKLGEEVAASAVPRLDPRLVGTWVKEVRSTVRGVDDMFVFVSYHYLTIHGDGRFEEKTQSAGSHADGTVQGGDRVQGWVTMAGRMLNFVADGGQRWSATYELLGADGLRLNGELDIHIKR